MRVPRGADSLRTTRRSRSALAEDLLPPRYNPRVSTMPFDATKPSGVSGGL
jgi:hypothetical protein